MTVCVAQRKVIFNKLIQSGSHLNWTLSMALPTEGKNANTDGMLATRLNENVTLTIFVCGVRANLYLLLGYLHSISTHENRIYAQSAVYITCDHHLLIIIIFIGVFCT